MVVVEYMPDCWRESHRAAGNSGSYPFNGAVRVAVARACAEELVGADGAWTDITRADPAGYVDDDDAETEDPTVSV